MMYGGQEDPELYIDNVNTPESPIVRTATMGSTRSGHIVLGRHLAHGSGFTNGALTCDSLTIWDRRLSGEEREMLHGN